MNISNERLVSLSATASKIKFFILLNFHDGRRARCRALRRRYQEREAHRSQWFAHEANAAAIGLLKSAVNPVARPDRRPGVARRPGHCSTRGRDGATRRVAQTGFAVPPPWP